MGLDFRSVGSYIFSFLSVSKKNCISCLSNFYWITSNILFQTKSRYVSKYLYFFSGEKKSDGLLLTLSHLSSDNCRGDWKMSRLGLFLRWILGTCWAMCQPAAEIFGAKMEKKTSHFKSFLAFYLLTSLRSLLLTNVQSVNNNDIYGLSLKKKRVTKSIQIATDLSIVKLGRSCLSLEFTHSNKFLTLLFGCICTLHGGKKIWKRLILIIFGFLRFPIGREFYR